MERIYEHISLVHSTDFYQNFNSLDGKLSVDEIFGEKYFVNAKSMGTAQHPHFEYDTTKRSSKDEGVFNENYGNPLCSVNLSRRILSIEKTDEKVSMKIFYYERTRKVGKPYFVKTTAMHFITYNYKTNSIYYGSLINYHKKRKCVKRLRRAVLCEDPVNHFQNRINDFFNGPIFGGGSVNFEKFDTSLPIKKFIDTIPTIKEFDVEDKYTLYRHFLVTGGVKLPNNWKCLIETYPQPKKTDYKKVGFKYVDALMSVRDMKGDKLKRALHRIKSLNMVSYEFAVNFFGLDFLLSRPDDEIELILDNPVYFHEYRGDIEFSKTELKNIYSIYKLVCLKVIDYTSFTDHIYFKPKILKYQDIKWKSNTLDKFNEEHVEWSEIIDGYTDGVVTRRYDTRFLNKVRELILVDGIEFTPVILTTSSEYNDESAIQSNCVRTYINKPECFIVSLRKVTGERITVEYLTEVNKEEKITLRRIQTKEKFNKVPDSSWDGALDVLDNKIKSLVRGGHYSLPEKDVEYKLGLSKHSKGVIYNTGFFNTVSWDDEVERFNMSYHDDDDLPL